MKKLLYIVASFAVQFIVDGLFLSSANAGPPFTAVKRDVSGRCGIQAINGQFSGNESRYQSRGDCDILRDTNDANASTFDKVSIIGNIQWTGQGSYQSFGGGVYAKTLPNNTSEVISVRQTLVDYPGQVWVGTLSATMTCTADPWREPDSRGCAAIRREKSGSIDERVDSLYTTNLVVPRTSLLHPNLRAALQQQYTHAMQMQQLQRMQNTPAGATTKSLPSLGQRASNAGVSQGATQAPILIGPLTITLPVANSRVVQGKLQVKASPPAGFTDINAASAWLEFTWLDTPPTAKVRPYVNTYPVTLSALMKGHPVPVQVTAGQTGRWQVRARITSPALGAWSTAVPFVLALQ